MRPSVIISLAMATIASADTLSTISSTITCAFPCKASSSVIAPSSFLYSNSSSTIADLVDAGDATLAPATTAPPTSADPSSTSKKHRSTIYEIDSDIVDSTFQVTKTICDDNSICFTTTDVESLATLTTSVDGILTVLTTILPVSSTADEDDSPLTSTTLIPPSTIYNTISDNQIIYKTITHCSNDVCSTTVEKDTLTTYTSTVNGIETIVTTVCPLTETTASSEAPVETTPTPAPAPTTVTESIDSTTVITITSCSDHLCTRYPKTTGVTVVTTTINDVTTEYTTYCPLTSSEETTPVPATTSTPPPPPPPAPKPTTTKTTETVTPPAPSPTSTTVAPVESSTEETTINVITDNIVTETPSLTTQSVSTTSSEVPQPPVITSFNKGTSVQGAGILGFLIPVVLALF